MKRRWPIFTALCFMLTAFTLSTGAPGARADSLQDQINALKAEVTKLEGQQMELKKQATEAAAALPTFSYRAGSGVLMEAADKSWSLRFINRIHYWMLFRDGKHNSDTEREGDGELFARRIRPTFHYCVNDCFYEIEAALDLDSGDAVELQRAAAYIHFEKINPWLPTWVMGIDSPTAWNRRRSSSSGGQLDYDMLTRSVGNTFSQGWNYGPIWEDKPLTSIGIPGTLEWLEFKVGSGPGNASDGTAFFVHSDAKSYIVSLAISPFSQTKSKWISGLELSWGAWFCNFDPRASENGACDDSPIRETDGPNRATMWDADVNETTSGEGMHRLHGVSARWRVGPYQLLATGHWFVAEDVLVRHRNWHIGHELYVWSPKGFLTGSSSTPGSILLGTHFERSDGRCNAGTCANGGEFNNNHAILVSGSIYYIIQRGLNVGVHWNHYDAKKLRTGVQEDLDIRSTGVVGRGGNWDNIMLVFRWEF